MVLQFSWVFPYSITLTTMQFLSFSLTVLFDCLSLAVRQTMCQWRIASLPSCLPVLRSALVSRVNRPLCPTVAMNHKGPQQLKPTKRVVLGPFFPPVHIPCSCCCYSLVPNHWDCWEDNPSSSVLFLSFLWSHFFFLSLSAIILSFFVSHLTE